MIGSFWLSWFLSMFVSHLWKYICEYLAYHKLLWIQVIVSADIFPIWAFLHMLPTFYVLNCLGNVNVCIADLVQDWSNISALAMELLQACTKPSVYFHFTLSPTQEHHMLKFILKEDKKTSTACSQYHGCWCPAITASTGMILARELVHYKDDILPV